MVIYNKNGTPILNIKVDDSSYRYEEIMGSCMVYLEFALTQHVEIEPGSYVIFEGKQYVLYTREGVSIKHGRNFEYKITFEGPQTRFKKYVFYNYIDGRVKFDMIGEPIDFLTHIVANLNQREPNTWNLGSYITDVPQQLISFNHNKMEDALNMVCQAFDTEWEVVTHSGGGYAINLKKVEYNQGSPLALSYGKNQGFKPGVGRLNYGEYGQVEKVFMEGSDRNVAVSNYGNSTLHFPKDFAFSIDEDGKFSYTIDGSTHTQSGFNSASALEFVTDEYGASVRLADSPASCNEVSLDLTSIYPSRTGTVTDVYYLYKNKYMTYAELTEEFPDLTDDDWLNIQVDIVDSTIADETVGDGTLVYKPFANDDPLVVIFQSGQLRGREFNATFVKEALTKTIPGEGSAEDEVVVLRPANRFELVRASADGYDMPNATFRPNAASGSDTYIVTNCEMPDQYICDFEHFEGAELDALREACKFIRENKDPQFSFKGEVDNLYVVRNWGAVGDKLKLGGYISFQHDDIQPEAISARITAIKTYVNSPYSPQITLSNEMVKGGMSSTIAKLSGQEAHIEEAARGARRFSKRSFRDAKETIDMLQGALDYFSGGINPITVETMSLLVGDESLQFKFFEDRTCAVALVNPPIAYDPDTHTVVGAQCAIQHMTLGLKDIKPSTARTVDEYLRWSMIEYESAPITGIDEQGNDLSATAYYVYAKVDAQNSVEDGVNHITGTFEISPTKKGMRDEYIENPTSGQNSYYYLLVGILNSEYDGDRSFAPMYGFTEVLPGQITTDVIRSASGTSYFDLANNQFKLGDRLQFVNGQLTLKGTIVQSAAGEATAELGVWRGQWTSGTDYAKGDEVWWQASDGTIGTYRYINESQSTASSSNNPSHTNYWTPTSKGAVGKTGSFKSTAFIRTNDELTASDTPSGGTFSSPIPTSTHTDTATSTVLSWSDGIPAGDAMLWASTCVFNSDGTSGGWTQPRQMTDTETYDVEFAFMQANDEDPDAPSDNPNNRHDTSNPYGYTGQVWFDPELDKYSASGVLRDFKPAYWRAERECVNGAYGDWTIMRVKGEKGEEGNGIASMEDAWQSSANGDTPPTGTWVTQHDVDEGVTKPQPSAGMFLWTRTTIKYTDTSKPDKVLYSAVYCAQNGAAGPALLGRGEYDAGETYTGTSDRRDVVYFPSTKMWYMANETAGNFSNQPPATRVGVYGDWTTNTDYWSNFMSNFSNVATGLLFTERAFIENAIIRMLETSNSGKRVVINDDVMRMFDANDNVRLQISGDDLQAAGTSTNFTLPDYGFFSENISYPADEINDGSYIDRATGSEDNSVVVNGVGPSITIPSRTLSYSVGAALTKGSLSYGIHVYLVIDGEAERIKSTYGNLTTSNTSVSSTLSVPARVLSLANGTHSIGYRVDMEFSGTTTAVSNHRLIYSASFASSASGSISYSTQLTEIGANGFRVALGSNHMFQCVISGSETTFSMESDDVGIKVSSTGGGTGTMMMRFGGVWYYAYKDSSNNLKLSTTAPS